MQDAEKRAMAAERLVLSPACLEAGSSQLLCVLGGPCGRTAVQLIPGLAWCPCSCSRRVDL